MAGQNALTPSIAAAPFDENPLADITITTCDGVDFYLVKGILAMASHFFRGMLSLKQPIEGQPAVLVPSISVSEDSQTFDALMRLCYPIRDPLIHDIRLLEKVLEAALKYDMDEATQLMREKFRTYSKSQTLAMYAAACRLDLEEEAALAASVWKKKQADILKLSNPEFTATPAGGSYVPAMANISSAAYYRLLHSMYTKDTKDSRFTSPPRTFATESACNFQIPSKVADVILRSTDDILFYAHRAVLLLAFADKLLGPEAVSESNGSDAEVAVDLDSASLRALLHFCYPLSPQQCRGLPQAILVLKAAAKYDMTSIVCSVKETLMTFIDTDPLAVYFTASIHGWTSEATAAARIAIVKDITDVYVPQMEDAPASVYHSLLAFQHQYAQTVKSVIQAHVPEATDWQSLSEARRRNTPLLVSLPILELVVSDMRNMKDAFTARTCCFCEAYRSSLRCSCPKKELYQDGAMDKLITRGEGLQSNLDEAISKV